MMDLQYSMHGYVLYGCIVANTHSHIQEHLGNPAGSVDRDPEPAVAAGWSLADAIGFVTQYASKHDMLKNKPAGMDAEMWEEIDVVYDLCHQFGSDVNTIHEKLVAHFEGEKAEVGASQPSGLNELASGTCKDPTMQGGDAHASSEEHEDMKARQDVADFLEQTEESQPNEDMIDRRMAMLSQCQNADNLTTIPFIDLEGDDYVPPQCQTTEVPAASGMPEVPPSLMPEVPPEIATPLPDAVPPASEMSEVPSSLMPEVPPTSEMPEGPAASGTINGLEGGEMPSSSKDVQPLPWRSPPSLTNLTAMESMESLGDPAAAAEEEAIP